MDIYDGNNDIEVGGYAPEEKKIDIVKTKSGFIAKTYAFMALALLISCAVAFAVPAVFGAQIVYDPWLILVCAILEIVVVIVFSATLKKASFPVALLLYLGYSVLSGATLSVIFAAVEVNTFFIAFGATAVVFGCMSAIGLITKKDLSRWWIVIVFGLIAISVASLIAWIFTSDALSTLVCGLGVLLFMGVTVFDSNMMKRYHEQISDEKMLNKISLYCALQLYLDFINILIRLLALLSRNRK